MLRYLVLVISMLVSTIAIGAEWKVDRVRGEVLYSAGSGWVQLAPGAEIANGGVIQTGSNARVDLSRGKDRVTLGASTKVQIKDAGSKLMTTVIQSAGTVSVDVERRNVRHFAVQTPFLAAVVKGTKFVVTVNRKGTTVSVSRGVVAVRERATGTTVDVLPGQKAAAGLAKALSVNGLGVKAGAKGAAASDGKAAAGKANAGGNGNGNGNSNANGKSNSKASENASD